MESSENFTPDWVSAPGRTVTEILRHKQIGVDEFSRLTGFPSHEIEHLVSGRLTITLDVASRLQQSIGGSVEFWVARDYQYREDSERLLGDSTQWIRQLPISDMRRFGWLEKASTPGEDLESCLDFFEVRSVGEWDSKYAFIQEEVLFRKTETFESRPASIAAWLRQGEREAAKVPTSEWNNVRFSESLSEVRKLTREKTPELFLPKLIKLCAESGVALVIVRTPSGCPASGAVRFLGSGRAMLMLSFRHLSDDHFWFSFFHEAAHLILHHPDDFLVEIDEDSGSRREMEANEFAQNVIVPQAHRREFLGLKSRSLDIIRFARKIGVSPGLVVGQLQFFGVLGFNQQNKLKRRYVWG